MHNFKNPCYKHEHIVQRALSHTMFSFTSKCQPWLAYSHPLFSDTQPQPPRPLLLASTLPTPAVKHRKCFLCLHIKSPRRIWISHFSSACCCWLEPFCLLDWKQLKTPPSAACSWDQDPGEFWRPVIPDTELSATFCFPTSLHHSIHQSPGRRSAGDLANAKRWS